MSDLVKSARENFTQKMELFCLSIDDEMDFMKKSRLHKSDEFDKEWELCHQPRKFRRTKVPKK